MPVDKNTEVAQSLKNLLGTELDGSLKTVENIQATIIANVEAPKELGVQDAPQD